MSKDPFIILIPRQQILYLPYDTFLIQSILIQIVQDSFFPLTDPLKSAITIFLLSEL